MLLPWWLGLALHQSLTRRAAAKPTWPAAVPAPAAAAPLHVWPQHVAPHAAVHVATLKAPARAPVIPPPAHGAVKAKNKGSSKPPVRPIPAEKDNLPLRSARFGVAELAVRLVDGYLPLAHRIARLMKTRPPPSADPEVHNQWCSHVAMLGPLYMYPEFDWHPTGKGHEAIGLFHRSDSDWVHWYIAPDASTWSYEHHTTSGGFDLGRAVSQAANAVSQAASAAGQVVTVATTPFASAVQWADGVMQDGLSKLASALPPEARPFVEALKMATHYLATQAEESVAPESVDWKQVAHNLEAATSTVPVLGTAVADVVATAEVICDAVRSGDPLEAAIRAAYDYAMSSVPGAASLRTFLDPVVDVLIGIAVKHESPTRAVIDAAVRQAPESPSVAHLSPRTVAASLAAVIVDKLGIK